MRTLARNRKYGMLTGLCAAIANQLNVDPIIVRMVVVFLTIASGLLPGIVAYLFGWIFTPTLDQPAPCQRLTSWFRSEPTDWEKAEVDASLKRVVAKTGASSKPEDS